MSKINKYKWTYGLFDHNYRVAALSTLYLNVLVIIIPSLKSIGQFWHIDFLVMITELLRFTKLLLE